VTYTPPSVREATEALVALLRLDIDPPLSIDPTDTTAGVHDGQAPGSPPKDSLGVHPYAVVYADPGAPEPRFTGIEGALTITWQVTCVGGTQERCLAAVDRARAALHGARVRVPGGPSSGTLAPPPGYTPGPVRRDPERTPQGAEQHRFFVPLQYRATFAAGAGGS